jgi:hypothetical protein
MPNQGNPSQNQNTNNDQTALLAQIQALTSSIQSMSQNSNQDSKTLLATHDYLASKRRTRNSRATPYGNRPVGQPQKESSEKILDEKFFEPEQEED